MNIKTRLNKLEQYTGAGGNFCHCGTLYSFTFIIGSGSQPANICPACGLDVKPPTREDFENGQKINVLPGTNITKETISEY